MKPGRLRDGRSICRVTFDEEYVERSQVWLQDPELVSLIRAATEFDARAQRQWYDGLAARIDYAIWGMDCGGVPVGAIGIKHIGAADGAEYFMYIGERNYWHVGIGRWALNEIQDEIRSRGLSWVYGRIAQHNERSRLAHFALGLRPLREEDDETVVGMHVDDPVH